jgi:hypothetical protein
MIRSYRCLFVTSHLSMLFLALSACESVKTENPTDPAKANVVEALAEPTVESPPPEPVGHCAADEYAFFSCTVTDGKTLSICGSEPSDQGWLQYRFGAPANVELAFPDDRKYSRFFFEKTRHSRSDSVSVGFVNGAYQFTVEFQEGGIDQNFAGVVVSKNGTSVATKTCQWADLKADLIKLESVLSPKSEWKSAPIEKNICDGDWTDYPCRPFPACCE